MPIVLVLAVAVHGSSSVFWAGSTFALTRTGGGGAGKLFQPGAATVAVLTGAYLWSQLHRGFGISEQVLLVGVACAFAAAGVQGALIGPALRVAAGSAFVRRALIAHRIAAALLSVTLICMVEARYV
jgi:hypothetical protein